MRHLLSETVFEVRHLLSEKRDQQDTCWMKDLLSETLVEVIQLLRGGVRHTFANTFLWQTPKKGYYLPKFAKKLCLFKCLTTILHSYRCLKIYLEQFRKQKLQLLKE